MITSDVQEFLRRWHSPDDLIEVHTSGSTGPAKSMQVEKYRMVASAKSTCSFLRIPQGASALLCMPTRYIAGMMMIVRAEVWPLTLTAVEPSNHPLRNISAPPFFVAMTPAQAYASLQEEQERHILLQIPRLLIGGGSISPELEASLRNSKGEVWSSYGMTETLSHIALRRIGTPGYKCLPNVTIGLTPEGTLWVEAPLITPCRLTTRDMAELLPDGTFCITGRLDNVISSGGIKLQLEKLECDLATATGLHIAEDFMLTWVKDVQWGQALTIILRENTPTPHNIKAHLPYLKHILTTTILPLTPTGKPAREQAHLLAERLIKS